MKRCFSIFVFALFIGIVLLNSLSSAEGDSDATTRAIYEIVEQCSDGVQNYDETGVDCGGSCSACSAAAGGGGGGGGAHPGGHRRRDAAGRSPRQVPLLPASAARIAPPP